MEHFEQNHYCKICDYRCLDKDVFDFHNLTPIHSSNLNVLRDNLQKDKKLYYKFLGELNIDNDDENPKPKRILIEEILDKLSNQIIDDTVPEIFITNEPQLELIHELTQFTHGKTEQTLNKIAERYYINTMNQDEHLIQLILTNKSLMETRQWKIRTKNRMNEYENIEVVVLSSEQESEYHNIDKFICSIVSAKTKKDLPNVMIACFHKRRIQDVLKLLDAFKGTNFMVDSVKINFNISFDEPDANLGLCSLFLSEYKIYKQIIQHIEFITATPYVEFWKMLNDNGIVELINPKYQKDDCKCDSYEEQLENYRQIKDHTHRVCNYKTNNPLEYIRYVFQNEREEQVKYIDMDDGIRKIIFSPAHTCRDKEGVGSHEEVVSFYNNLDFTVYLSNGCFKGFIEPSGERIKLDDFNKIYNIKDELRESLRKWAELNPSTNLAITGYLTLERGVTLQTKNFNFTHVIISDYHKKLLNKLIQLIGRSTGNKKYVENICIIVCSQEIIDIVKTFVNKTIELRKGNPENYNFTDFTDKNSCIPVKVTFVDEGYRLLIMEITNKVQFHNMLKEGYQKGMIILDDRNNIRVFTNDKKNKTKIFDDVHKKISGFRKYKLNDNISSRRFEQFNKNFTSLKPASQKSEPGEYNIDFALDRYEHNGYVNEVNIAWITFMY